jgi:hypothetical protein
MQRSQKVVMTRYYYDLHIHSCLSPCADDDMTPANIAGMGAVNGLQLMALTDHNSCKNCPAFFEACKAHGIVPVAGMELTTAEEIHIICLFRTLESALLFNGEITAHRAKVKNKKNIFGNQLLMGAHDEILGEEEHLLILATDLSLDAAYALVLKYDGAAYPAHIDREANGIIAILGGMPVSPEFKFVEFNDKDNLQSYYEKYHLTGKKHICSSDAHTLWEVNEAVNFLELHDEPYSGARVRQALIDKILKG